MTRPGLGQLWNRFNAPAPPLTAALMGAVAILLLIAAAYPRWLTSAAVGFPDPAVEQNVWGADARLVMWVLT